MDAALVSRIERLLEEIDFSGAVQVVDAGRVVFERARGLARRDECTPITRDTQFALASGTKAFTALTIMSLVVDGLLSLDAPVQTLLLGETELTDAAVTVRHLLAHTSGIGDYLDEGALADVEDFVLAVPAEQLTQPRDFLPLLRGRQPMFSAGERFAYSNSGYVLLALVIEAVSGVSYYDAVRSRVFEPAGMARSGFPRLDELPASAAIGYLPKRGWRTNATQIPVRGGGDGGAYATLDDIGRFWVSLFEGRVVPLERVAEMVRPWTNRASSRSYGLGFWLTDGTVQLEGSDPGISFRSAFNPSTKRSYTVLSNTTGGARPLARELEVSLEVG